MCAIFIPSDFVPLGLNRNQRRGYEMRHAFRVQPEQSLRKPTPTAMPTFSQLSLLPQVFGRQGSENSQQKQQDDEAG